MEQAESSVKETTINIQHFDNADIQEGKMVRFKETKPSQIFMYLIAIYFLSVALFYLVLCLKRTRYVECQLQCQQADLYCQCEIKSRVGWSTPTYLQLTWSASDIPKDTYEQMAIQQAIIYDKQSILAVEIESYAEVNCFPNGCIISVGLIKQSIEDNSKFIIQFKQKINVSQKYNFKMLFREIDSSYPQLQTLPQLAINLLFSIVVGILVFLRQKMDIEVTPPMHIKNKKILESEQDQKQKVEFPEDIVALNQQLQRNRNKAIQILLKRVNKNIHFQPIQDQQSNQFTFTYTL